LLARMRDAELLVLDGLNLEEPKTREVARALEAIGAERACLLVIADQDCVLWKSARNVSRLLVRPVTDLNAYEVLRPNRVVFTRPAFEALVGSRKR